MTRLSPAHPDQIAAAAGRFPASVSDMSRITVCYPLAGDCLGGSHVSLRGLLEGLDSRRYRQIVVPEIADGSLARFFSDSEQMPDPAPPARSFEPGRPFGPAQFAQTLGGLGKRVAFLRANQVDIVHSNDGRTHATWALAAKLAGAKLVWHHRGNPDARGLRYVAPVLADRIVTVSRFAMPRKSIGASRDAKVIYSPFDVSLSVDRAKARNAIVAELGCPEDTAICGYFGSFIDRKRPVEFVEAIVELRQMLSRPVMGLLFGEGGYPELEDRLSLRIAQPDAQGWVRQMGYRSPGHDWIAGCDALLVPAVDEPLGRTLVEAMIVRTPVVATDSGGNPEALDHGCGILVPPDDPRAMAQATAAMLAEPQKSHAMAERAAHIAAERFSRSRHCSSVEQVYAELIGSRA